jgi:hypothetical protein
MNGGNIVSECESLRRAGFMDVFPFLGLSLIFMCRKPPQHEIMDPTSSARYANSLILFPTPCSVVVLEAPPVSRC